MSFRSRTVESLALAQSVRLIEIDHEGAKIRGIAATPPELPENLQRMGNCSYKLGLWFGRLYPADVEALLGVRF